MDDQKKKALTELIQTANELDLASVTLLLNGANMLQARENLDSADLVEKHKDDLDLRAD